MNYTIRKSLILNNWYRTFLKNIHPLEHKALMNRTSTEASLSYESLLHRCGLLQRLWSKSEGIGALTLWLWSIWFWSSELGSSTTTQDAHYKIMKRSCIVVAVLYVNYLLSQIHIAFPKIAWTALIKKSLLPSSHLVLEMSFQCIGQEHVNSSPFPGTHVWEHNPLFSSQGCTARWRVVRKY